jgi:hypothetical protein
MRRSCVSVGGDSPTVTSPRWRSSAITLIEVRAAPASATSRPQLVLIVQREPLGQQDERLVSVHRRQLAEDGREPGHRLLRLLAQAAGDLAGFGDDVALALRALRRFGAAAFAVGHRREHELIAAVGDGQRLGDADVVLPRNRARMLSDQPLHGEAEAQLVGGEVDARPGLGEDDEGDLVERTEFVEKARGRGHDRADGARPDVHLIDGDDDLAAVGRREIARVEGSRSCRRPLSSRLRRRPSRAPPTPRGAARRRSSRKIRQRPGPQPGCRGRPRRRRQP